MIREPAAAVAASICWLARWRGDTAQYARTASIRHPRECAWCPYPLNTLVGWLVEFNDLDLIPGRDYSLPNGHALARSFMQLPAERQRELTDAQLYPPVMA